MKIFTAGFLTETNTFAPFPTGLETFREMMFYRRGECVEETADNDICRVFIERAKALGWEVEAGLRCFAQPAGYVPQSVYEALRDELLDDLRAAMPVDAVLLSLHGAMVAESEFDGEGDTVERVRSIVGPDVPVGAHCDPHCHLTEKMVANLDVLKIWKEYPHTDIAERAGEVFDLVKARLEGAPRAVPVVYDCRMTQMLHTSREPMRSFVDRAIALEGKHGIQSISVAHSFPWGDVPDMGTRVLVYAESEDHRPHAEALARELGGQLWAQREQAATPLCGIDDCLDRAYSAPRGPVVIADSPDNPGGGAPGDSTYFLARLLERGESDWAIGYLFDPQAVRIAVEAGKGARLRLRIGGKTCELSGEPVDVDARVQAIRRNEHAMFGSLKMKVGDAVSLDLGDNRHLLLTSARNQAFDHELFGRCGIDLRSKRAVVVKSSQHFYASFSPLAAEVLYASCPGVVNPDLASLEYRYADTTIWPLADYRGS